MEGIEATSRLASGDNKPAVLQKDHIESYVAHDGGVLVTMISGKEHFVVDQGEGSAYERVKQAMGPIGVRPLWSNMPSTNPQWKDRV